MADLPPTVTSKFAQYEGATVPGNGGSHPEPKLSPYKVIVQFSWFDCQDEQPSVGPSCGVTLTTRGLQYDMPYAGELWSPTSIHISPAPPPLYFRAFNTMNVSLEYKNLSLAATTSSGDVIPIRKDGVDPKFMPASTG